MTYLGVALPALALALALAIGLGMTTQGRARARELGLRNEFLRILTGPLEDRVAYDELAGFIQRSLGTPQVLVAYRAGDGSFCGATRGDGPRDRLEAADLAALEAATQSRPPPWLAPGCHLLALRLDAEGETVGYVVAGGPRRIGRGEEELYRRVLSRFSGAIHNRWSRAVQEGLRQEDRSTLRWSEARLKTFFDESGDMIYSANADDILASINGAGLRILGHTDRLEVVGLPFAEFALSPGDRALFLRKLREDGKVDDYEIILKKAGGGVTFCLETARAVKDGSGRVVEIQGIVKDISERVERESQLWQANLELVDANAELSRTHLLMVQQEKLASIGHLAAGVAHEINNPLGFLKSNQETLNGYLATTVEAWEAATALDPLAHEQIARDLDLNYVFEEITSLLRESDEGLQRILDIVLNLRNFSRQEATSPTGNYDLNQGLESSLVMARNEIKYVAEVELSLGDLPVLAAAGGEVNQVFLNILVNAAQAIGGQKRPELGRIKVSTRKEGESAVVLIEDDGPGIPEEARLKVFDPFYTTKDPGKGTGLGLSISHDIVARKHGGTLRVVESSLGGAAFRIELPLTGPEPEAD